MHVQILEFIVHTGSPAYYAVIFFYLRENSHKINRFKVFRSVAFRIFTMSYNHPFYLVPEHFIPKGDLVSIKQALVVAVLKRLTSLESL